MSPNVHICRIDLLGKANKVVSQIGSILSRVPKAIVRKGRSSLRDFLSGLMKNLGMVKR